MGKRLLKALVASAICMLPVTACGGTSSTGTASASAASGLGVRGRIGVILPDTVSSTRWESADRVYLSAAFRAAGVDYDIQNADGDKARFQAIADSMIAGGVTVLMIASLDSASGAAVIKKAAASGIPVIDYDRLTLGGGAKYYVSFDNVAVGAVIGQGLVKGLQAAGKKTGTVIELNGSPTDNNATLFRQGYDQVIQQAGYRVVGSQPVPGWDGPMAVTVFSRMLADAGGNVDGVAAANDVLGGSAVSVLTTEGAAGKVVVTGQDATDAGLQRLLLGTQYVTVYKAIKLEASAAAKLAVALIKGDSAGADAQASGTITDSSTRVDVKSVLLKPKAIYKQNVKEVVADGYTTAAKLCTTPQLKAACAANGIS